MPRIRPMTPEQAKRRKYTEKLLRIKGISQYVPVEPVAQYVDLLRETMTQSEIAHQASQHKSLVLRGVSGVSKSTVSYVQSRTRATVHRDIAAAILKVRPAVIPTPTHRSMSSLRAQRQLQGLAAAGFSQNPFLIEYLDTNTSALWKVLHRETIGGSLDQRINDAYSKLQNARPEDYGISRHGQTMARNVARKHGWAPPMCWDDDTIGDPKAFPEWTGACGTKRGLSLHKTEGIPMTRCRPCLDLRKKVWRPRRSAGHAVQQPKLKPDKG